MPIFSDPPLEFPKSASGKIGKNRVAPPPPPPNFSSDIQGEFRQPRPLIGHSKAQIWKFQEEINLILELYNCKA